MADVTTLPEATRPARAVHPWPVRWRDYLLAEVDGASLAVFRACFGLIMAWEVGRYFQHGWIARYYIEPAFHFSYLPFIQPWPGQGMYWHFAATGLLALLVAAGLYYRVAAWLCCLAFSYIFLLDKAQYHNHLYLLALLSLLLALAPAHRAWSLDRVAGLPGWLPTVPRWSLLLLRFQIALVYLFGGIARLSGDGLRAQPPGGWLAHDQLPLAGPLLAQPWAGPALAWGGLLIGLSLPFLLLWPRTFWVGAVAALCLNLLNAQISGSGGFLWLMIAALALFPHPAWPRALVGGRALGPVPWSPPGGGRAMPPALIGLLAGLHLYACAQMLAPLRHWLYPGNVAWSNEGHRFAWRMRLHEREVDLTIFATNPHTRQREVVEPHRWLSAHQASKLAASPDMIHQFAHFVADQAESRGEPRPHVTVLAVARLNGGSPGYLIDPTVDLAAEPLSLAPARWIIPDPASTTRREAAPDRRPIAAPALPASPEARRSSPWLTPCSRASRQTRRAPAGWACRSRRAPQSWTGGWS